MVEIIRAGMDELPLVAALFDQYRVFYGQNSDISAAKDFLAARMVRNESVIFLAVENGNAQSPRVGSIAQITSTDTTDTLIPLGFVQLYPSFSSVTMQKLWILNDLFVDPSSRRQGVARRLMERAKDHALETGAKGLTLATASDNINAQRLYESLGYSIDTYIHYDFYFHK